MTNPDYTHLILVVDRSGSMQAVVKDAQGGIEHLLEEQAANKDDKITITITEFDNEINSVVRFADPAKISYSLEPRGSTALLDAVGQEINMTGIDLSNIKEEDRPGKVLFVVVTDGEENSSREFHLDKLRDMIRHQRENYNWQFQFVGADEAAWQGDALGMSTTRYAGDATGTQAVYSALSAGVGVYRKASPQAKFSMEEDLTEESEE